METVFSIFILYKMYRSNVIMLPIYFSIETTRTCECIPTVGNIKTNLFEHFCWTQIVSLWIIFSPPQLIPICVLFFLIHFHLSLSFIPDRRKYMQESLHIYLSSERKDYQYFDVITDIHRVYSCRGIPEQTWYGKRKKRNGNQ